MPRALQYGQSAEEFWHGDPFMFEAREKAYYRNLSQAGFIYGQYIFEAFQTGLYNALRKKGQQAKGYLKEPMELAEDQSETYRKAKEARKKSAKAKTERRQRQDMTSAFAFIENRYRGAENG